MGKRTGSRVVQGHTVGDKSADRRWCSASWHVFGFPQQPAAPPTISQPPPGSPRQISEFTLSVLHIRYFEKQKYVVGDTCSAPIQNQGLEKPSSRPDQGPERKIHHLSSGRRLAAASTNAAPPRRTQPRHGFRFRFRFRFRSSSSPSPTSATASCTLLGR